MNQLETFQKTTFIVLTIDNSRLKVDHKMLEAMGVRDLVFGMYCAGLNECKINRNAIQKIFWGLN